MPNHSEATSQYISQEQLGAKRYQEQVANAAAVNSKKIWKTKGTLKSHMDSVRGLYFHPIEKLLVSASEDGTLKVWDLAHQCENIDPYITLRGHTKALFALTGP